MITQAKETTQTPKRTSLCVLSIVFQDTEQDYHVAIYQFQDLATLFGVNIPKQ